MIEKTIKSLPHLSDYYDKNSKLVLCKSFVIRSLGTAPNKVRVSVSNKYKRNFKKVYLQNGYYSEDIDLNTKWRYVYWQARVDMHKLLNKKKVINTIYVKIKSLDN